MSRRHASEKRAILPDAKYGDIILGKFINCLMYAGRKATAEGIVYGAFEFIEKQGARDARQVFHMALENVKPALEVRSRRMGGATYAVPGEVRTERSLALGIRSLISASRKRPEKTMQERLASELLDASNQRGASVKKREDMHRMAEANKAFSHYRW